jgi:hypothetical protein
MGDMGEGALHREDEVTVKQRNICISNIDNTSHEEKTSNNRRKETLASPT